MEIKMEAKTLAIGILLGVLIVIALGADGTSTPLPARGGINAAGSADKSDYGLGIQNDGFAIVRTASGDFFSINPKTGMAIRILHTRRLSDDAARSRDNKGRLFNYFSNAPAEENGKDTYEK
jgi:hypothetical protein